MKRYTNKPVKTIDNGVEVETNNLDTMQDGPDESIKSRWLDCFSQGIINQSTGVPFLISDNGDGTISIGSGVGFDSSGERIEILSTDVTTYDASLPLEQTSDGIGGYVDTPKSSGCKSIPIPDDSVTYAIGIKYLFMCDSNNPSSPTNYNYHPETGKREFYKWIDGYEIEITTNTALITGLVLGLVNRTGSVISINMTGRTYASIKSVVNTTASSVVDGSITTPKLASKAVTGDKIADAVAGDGLSKDIAGNLKVAVDATTIESSGGVLQVKDASITGSKIAPSTINISNNNYTPMIVLLDHTLTSARSSIAISGLNSNTDFQYLVDMVVQNGYNGSCTYYLRYNSVSSIDYGWTLVAENYPAAPAQGAGINATQLTIGTNSAYWHFLWANMNICSILDQSSGTSYRILNNMMVNENAWSAGGAGYAGNLNMITGILSTTNPILSLLFIADKVGGLGVGTKIRIRSNGGVLPSSITVVES